MKIRWTRRGARVALLTTAGLLNVGALPLAHAALSENIGTGVVAMSLANAVTADPPGIESIHFNPAGLARLKGEQHTHSFLAASIRTHASFRQPDGFDIGGWTEDPLNGTHAGPVRQRLYIPGIGLLGARLPAAVGGGLGLSYNKPDSPFTFGTNTYVTSGVSFSRTQPSDPGNFDGKTTVIQRLVLASPSVGYKVSDTLSVGVAVPIAHAAMVMNTDMRNPNTLIGITGQVQEGWCPRDGGNLLDTLGPGLCSGGEEGRLNPFKKTASVNVEMTAPVDPTINLGILWEPTDSFALGVVYQGGSKTKYSGRYEFHTEPMLRKFVEGLYSSLQGPIIASILGMPSSIPEVQSGNLTATVPFPARMQVGVKLKPVERVQFNVDANYTDWGSWDALTLKFDQSIKMLEVARMFGVTDSTQLSMPRGYRSVLNWSFGTQIKVTDKFLLRLGYEPRKSSIPTDKLDVIAPMPDTKLYSVGFNYKVNAETDINVAASYMKGDFHVPANGSCNMNCNKFFNIIYNPYAGLDVSGGIRIRYFGFSLTKRF